VLTRPPSWNLGVLLLWGRGEGKRERKGKGRKEKLREDRLKGGEVTPIHIVAMPLSLKLTF